MSAAVAFVGASAHSEFRRDRIAAVCGIAADALSSRRLFFVALENPPAPDRRESLMRLLQADEEFREPKSHGDFVVAPRLGTISPWSSKATDIAHRCGFGEVIRVESGVWWRVNASDFDDEKIAGALCDRMTESILRPPNLGGWRKLFRQNKARGFSTAPILNRGEEAIREADRQFGLALSADEISHLAAIARELNRDLTDAELMMFAQANSEHCRHKIFNAPRIADGEKSESLMQKIRSTHSASPTGTLVAYEDNAAILEGGKEAAFFPDDDGIYRESQKVFHLVAKSETHNHPTAISPRPGAATGSGGEIRDEAAAGRGASSRAGLCGFMVSRLHFSNAIRAPKKSVIPPPPPHIAPPLQIMIEGPVGAASFNNEFGRPSLGGFFREFESQIGGDNFGYHKPLMLAAGIGKIAQEDAIKKAIPPGALLVHLGGPGMRIGMGGGGASSGGGGMRELSLDFDSVQRDNPEMQRRTQEVINQCGGKDNPILALHDVGAGGIANAAAELAASNGLGFQIDLRAIPAAESGMTPAEIWCNESQERFLLAILKKDWRRLQKICMRERCPVAVIGETTSNGDAVVFDSVLKEEGGMPVAIPIRAVIGGVPKAMRETISHRSKFSPLNLSGIDLREAAYCVLRHPAVADKRFLITIGDRTVGGLTARDQMVGRWQTAVADCAVILADYRHYHGEAMAAGERPGIALLSPAASARIAVGESLTNLAAADVINWKRVKLSLNWMANCAAKKGEAELVEGVNALTNGFCRQLGISIPVGKDSLSMAMQWKENNKEYKVRAPMTAVAVAFSKVNDARRTWTPVLSEEDETILMLVSPQESNRLGGGILSQVFFRNGGEPPDADADSLGKFLDALSELRRQNIVLSYHDRSDGGMFAAVCEMAFATNCGATLALDALIQPAQGMDADGVEMSSDSFSAAGIELMLGFLFNEELGALIQIRRRDAARALDIFSACGLPKAAQTVGWPTQNRRMIIVRNGRAVLDESLSDLRRAWGEASSAIARARDNPLCADEEAARDFDSDPGLFSRINFNPSQNIAAPFIAGGIRPRVAILREQGTNGHRELAAAFNRAGFEARDIHISDLESEGGGGGLKEFCGIALGGGFSFGDVLGAGRGLALSILHNPRLKEMFAEFFNRDDSFSLGICNGCQTLSLLRPLMPESDSFSFPKFMRNRSEQFEARFVMAEILSSPSLFFNGMAECCLPISSAHGEGRAIIEGGGGGVIAAARFVDNNGDATERYPFNPNGSPGGAMAFSSPDGRATIIMSHPERVVRAVQNSWHPADWGDDSPWLRIFQNARKWAG